jgi:flagellar biosynthesis protein FlhB
MKFLLSTLDIVFYVVVRFAILIVLIAYLCSCYEYRKFPNTKRVTKREVNKAMKHSTSEYEMPKIKSYNH